MAGSLSHRDLLACANVLRELYVRLSLDEFSGRLLPLLHELVPSVTLAYNEMAVNLRDVGEGMASINRAVVLAGRDGRLRWMNDLGREWLRELFPGNASRTFLPAPLKRWLCETRPGRPEFSTLRLTSRAGHPYVIYCGRTAEGDFMLALVRERRQINPEAAEQYGLTPRETEVLYWLSEAKTNPEIAAILKTSPRTIHKHTERLFAKLGVENRLAAQRIAWDLRRV